MLISVKPAFGHVSMLPVPGIPRTEPLICRLVEVDPHLGEVAGVGTAQRPPEGTPTLGLLDAGPHRVHPRAAAG